MIIARLLILVGLTAALTAACERAEPLGAGDGGGVQPTLSSIQANIFDRSCAVPSCHEGPGAPHDLQLTAGNSYGNLVGVASEQTALLRVEAGNPDGSYLIRKLEGGPDIVFAQMPRGRDPLPQDEIDAIREWIADGAADN